MVAEQVTTEPERTPKRGSLGAKPCGEGISYGFL